MDSIVVLCFLTTVTAVLSAVATVNTTCPPDVLASVDHKYLQVHDGLCFQFVLEQNQHKNYADASKDCMKGGGTLAMPKEQPLSDFLTAQLTDHYGQSGEVWIGLNRNKPEEKFVWEDGSEMVWDNFDASYDPSSRWFGVSMYDCIALNINNGGFWVDAMCKGDVFSWIARSDQRKAYICQYESKDLPTGLIDSPSQQDTPQVSRTIDNTCPPSLLNTTDRFYLQVHGDSCFHFVFNQDKNYPEAHKDCIQDGGTLALPQTQSANDFLTEQLLDHYGKPDEIWIGLRYNIARQALTWEDGSELSWDNFADGKGPGSSWLDVDVEECVALRPDDGGSWHDEECKGELFSLVLGSNHEKAYVCQYKPGADESSNQDPTRTIDNTCPSGLVTAAKRYYLQVWGSSCFRFVLDNPLVYAYANKDCETDGGTLALPKSQALNDFITDKLLNYYRNFDKAWIGLHDLKEESHFVWEDGSELGWSNFADGQGADNSWLAKGVEDCVALDPQDQGKWHDFQCDHNLLSWMSRPDPRKIYICQYPSVVRG